MAYTTIDDPSAYFKVHLYTGTGSSNAQTFADTDTDMQPDLVWIKTRGVSESHVVFDSVRTNGYYLKTDANSAEIDGSSGGSNLWTSFDSDGFTVNSTGARTNTNTYTYAAWCWKAGTTSGINTTGADTTPSGYSFNQTSGFSIIAYTGTGVADDKIPHGLGAVPHLIICKKRGNTGNWAIYHHKNTSAPATDYLYLDTTAATADDAGYWNDTAPTSVLFTVGDNSRTNDNTTMAAYCWAEKQGFSKFGSYTGNGNADGPMLHMGFSPAWIMCKKTSATGDSWTILDNKRDPYNIADARLFPDQTAAESTSTDVGDFLSNGFKIRTTAGTWNDSGGTYIYAAFAEAPFVNSNGVPTTAR